MSKEQKQFGKKNILFWIIYLLIFLGICFRFYVVFEFPPINHLFSDPDRHWTLAQNLFGNDPMSIIDPVGYQLWLAAILWITQKNPLLIGLYTWLISILTPWLWYIFFRELTGDKFWSLVGWLILLWLPSWIGIFSYFMIETLLLPLLGLALFVTWKNLKNANWGNWIYFNFAWIFASITKLISLPLAVISFVFYFCNKDFPWKKFIISSVLISIVLIPLSYRSYQSLGVYAPLGFPLMNQIYQQSGKKNIKFIIKDRGFWEYSSPSLYVNPFEGLFSWNSKRDGIVEFTVDTNNGVQDWNQAFENTQGDFQTRINMLIENAIFILFSSSWPDNNKEHFVENWSIKMRWIWAPTLLLVCIWNIFYFLRRKKLSLIILLNTAAWFVCFLSPSGVMEGRYRKPLEGLLIANVIFLAARYRQTGGKSSEELEYKKVNLTQEYRRDKIKY